MLDLEVLRRAGILANLSDAERDAMRTERDRQEPEQQLFEGVDPTSALSDDAVAALISEDARDLVIRFEVSDKKTYERRYAKPEWPHGPSGITIGIGYDIGYCTPSQITSHWKGLLSEPDIALLCRGAGLKGEAAKAALPGYQSIVVPYDVALEVYRKSVMPQYGRMVLKAFPNASELAGHAFGALFSLVYNRGPGMTDRKPGDRAEMRRIRELAAARQFSQIPDQIRAMKRLWQGTELTGLVKRREMEAQLFERGLQKSPAVTASTSATGGLESMASASPSAPDLLALDGDGRYDIDQPMLESSMEFTIWDQVSWAKDEISPDYSHITDRSLAGSTFDFGPAELELLIAANDFAPDRRFGRIIFALRGAELVTSLTTPATMPKQEDRPALTLRDVRPDHATRRCVIGVYNTATRHLSGYTSSTVPCRRAVATYKRQKTLGNMMPTGRYRFEVGYHHQADPAKRIPGCLIENGRQKAVLRSPNNYCYDTADTWENDHLHGDNLHPASSDRSAEFSSWGCLVVKGIYEAPGDRDHGTHTGEWAQFRTALGLVPSGTSDHRKVFDVVLLTGLEAAIAAKDPKALQNLRRLRQGSQGERVARLQHAMKLPVTGSFDYALAKAFADHQRADSLPVDGIYSPAHDAKYGIAVLADVPITVASAATSKLEGVDPGASQYESALASSDHQLESLYYEIGMLSEAARHRGASSGHESSLESIGPIMLSRSIDEFKSMGANLVRQLEVQLKAAICNDCAAPNGSASNLIAQKVENASLNSTTQARDYLLKQLGQIAGYGIIGMFLPQPIVERVVEAIMIAVVNPTIASFGDQVNLTTASLCQSWTQSLIARGVSEAQPLAALPVASPVQNIVPTTPPATSPLPGVSSPAGSEKIATLLDQMERASSPGDPAANAALRHGVEALRAQLAATGTELAPGQGKRLLDILCNSALMAEFQRTPSPATLIDGLESACKETPVNQAAKKRALADLRSLLSDARIPLQPEAMTRALKALRNARQFDDLAALSDAFATRDPAAFATIANSYAQGLIDSGRIVAGIHVLKGATASGAMTEPDAIAADGILGRAHKQIYVNHVRTPDDAAALGPIFSGHLTSAVENYGRRVDPQRPGENIWHGINYIAVLKRAQRDRIPLSGPHADPDRLARDMIAALTPAAAGTKDQWLLATLAEAHMALGEFDKAAPYMGRFAKMADAFALNGTVRQLEEVWQIKAGTEGAGAILTNLKARLASMDDGFLTLKPEEGRALAGAHSIAYQGEFESMTAGGKLMNFFTLQRAYLACSAVTAIQQDLGQSGRTIGTGFLIKGSDFSDILPADKSYVLTNAHVLWDRNFGGGSQGALGAEDAALPPDQARIIFESQVDLGKPEVYRCARVVWQSPSSLHDATLIELDRRVEGIAPIDVAPPSTQLVVACSENRGTRLTVVGHPNGGNLALGILGSMDDSQATLVDMGPPPNATDPVYLHYKTPTEPGNSGSPVLEMDTWRVVGLHHKGFSDKGNPKLGGKAGVNMANEGISISSIRDRVRAQVHQDQPPAPPSRPLGLFRR